MKKQLTIFQITCDYKSCGKTIKYSSSFYGDCFPTDWKVKMEGHSYVWAWMRWVCPSCFHKMSKRTQSKYTTAIPRGEKVPPPEYQLVNLPLRDPIIADYLEEHGLLDAARKLRD